MSRPLPNPIPSAPAHDGGAGRDDLHHLVQRLSRLWGVLRRRWHVVLLVTVIGSAAVFVRLSLLPARYVGEGLIQVGMNTEGAAAEEFRGTGLAKQVFNTQLKLLSSREVMLKALLRSNLKDGALEGRALEEALEEFRDEIRVRPIPNTFLVQVVSWGPTPEPVALRVNGLMEVFVTTSNEFVGARYLGEEQQAKAQEADLLRKLDEARKEQEALGERVGNVQFKEVRDALNVRNQQIERRSVELALERIAVTAEKQRLKPNLVANSTEPLETMLGRLPSQDSFRRLLEPLREAESAVQRLSGTLLAGHPLRQRAEKDVESQRRIVRRVLRVATQVRIASLGERLASLDEEDRRLKLVAAELKQEFQRLEKLEREARRIEGLVVWHEKELEATRAARWRAGGRSKVQMAAAIVNRSDVPSRPVSRLSPPVVTGTLFGMALLGLLIAVVWDQLEDQVIESEDGIPAGRPVLGRIPSIDLKGRTEKELLDELVSADVRSSAAESVRLLRTNLTFALRSEAQRTVLVTSSAPSAGKTLISLQLALVLAPTGGKTLLIDGDMRNPSIGKALGITAEQGLSEVLAGNAALSDVLVSSPYEGVSVLPSGAAPANPGDLLAEASFARLLGEARERFDCVVIDTPPVCGLADTSLMAPHGCDVLYVVRLNHTRRRLLENGLAQLSASGVDPIGYVVNGAPTGSPYRGYGYGYGYGQGSSSDRVPPASDA